MRPIPLLLVCASVLLAGCVDAGVQIIEDARNERGSDVPEESTAPSREEERAKEPPPPPAPTPAKPPAPRLPTPSPTPPPTPSPTPSPTAPPTPSPTPPPTPSPTPSPTAPPTPSPTPPPPPLSPSPAPPAWPREGSHARYEVEEDGATTILRWSYADGDWTGTCERPGEPTVSYQRSSPPHWPPFDTRDPPPAGEPVVVWWVEECAILRGEARYAGMRDGQHLAEADGFATAWDASTGLVRAWRTGDDEGRLVATDAPLAVPLR